MEDERNEEVHHRPRDSGVVGGDELLGDGEEMKVLVGGWVGGWVVGWEDRKVEEKQAVGMKCCGLGMGRWVGGWVGGLPTCSITLK